MKSSSFFGGTGTLANTGRWVNQANCEYTEFDIYVNEDAENGEGDPVVWVTDLPNEVPATNVVEFSLGQVVLHEFGHGSGLDHSDLDGSDLMLATMNTFYPGGGDISSIGYRIGEDDFVGLASLHPGGSSGRNLLVTKYTTESSPQGGSREAWTNLFEDEVQNIWCNVAGGFLDDGAAPTMPTFLMTGTGSAVTVNVKWRLNTPGTGCNGGDEYTIESRDFSLGVNAPFRPPDFNWTLPSNVPTGSYELCVIVDAADDITETEETLDNNVFSDKRFLVKSSLFDCF